MKKTLVALLASVTLSAPLATTAIAAELSVVGKPVILVPFPHAAADHQTKNAQALEEKGAAIHIPDSEADAQLVDAMLQLSKDTERQNELAQQLWNDPTGPSFKEVLLFCHLPC